MSSPQCGGFARQEEDPESCLCLAEPCPRFFDFQVRGLGSGDAGLGSKLIRGAVCEGGCFLDALILLGAGVSLEATQLLSLFAAPAACRLGPAALLLGLFPSQGSCVPLLARPLLCQATWGGERELQQMGLLGGEH